MVRNGAQRCGAECCHECGIGFITSAGLRRSVDNQPYDIDNPMENWDCLTEKFKIGGFEFFFSKNSELLYKLYGIGSQTIRDCIILHGWAIHKQSRFIWDWKIPHSLWIHKQSRFIWDWIILNSLWIHKQSRFIWDCLILRNMLWVNENKVITTSNQIKFDKDCENTSLKFP